MFIIGGRLMKLSIVEYSRGIDLVDLCPQFFSLDRIKSLLHRANTVIKDAIHLKRDPLVVSEGKLRALGIAGIIRLSKDFELEIIPKMLSEDENNWKESLFLLSALSKYGNIITNNHIHSNTAYKDSLYDIAGRVLAREFTNHKRKIIRQYRREQFYDYVVEGEIEFDKVFERNPEGLSQTRVSFDRINAYNSTIQAAMRIVLPYVKDSSIQQILMNAIQILGKQSPVKLQRLQVPSRNKEWNDIYNLSFDIVSGMGSSLENGEIMSPSFIVDTWRIWEWLITIAMKIGLGADYITIPQLTTEWGYKHLGDRTYKVNVFPDVAIYKRDNMDSPVLLIDAKYKSLANETTGEIDRADLYEAFAFCNATGVRKLLLAYPAFSDDLNESGDVTLVSDYCINDVSISAIKVVLGSITKQGDITSFCRNMASNIMSMGV